MTLNLADLFESVAHAVPDRIALVSGDRRLNYRDLDRSSSRFGHYLTQIGVRPGGRVGILSWNRAEWVEAMVGSLKARAVPVNLNYRYTASELTYVLRDSGCEVLVSEGSFEPVVTEIRDQLPLLEHWVVVDDGAPRAAPDSIRWNDALMRSSAQRDFGPRSSDDPYILYTGGTTGLPKGVVWRAEDIFAAALSGFASDRGSTDGTEELDRRVDPYDPAALRTLVLAPLMHGGGQWATLTVLFSGGTVYLLAERHFDPERVLDLVASEKIASITLVGDAHARPIAEVVAREPNRWDTSSLVAIASGGALLSPTVRAQLAESLPNVFVIDSFGTSETGSLGRATRDDRESRPRFAVGDEVAVLDPESLQALAPGDGRVGQLARRGHIPIGYLDQSGDADDTFVVDENGTRWALAGDYAALELDGTVTVLGRRSACINTGGEKVYAEEVESALKAHDGIFDAVVVGVPHERLGEQVTAVVVPRAGAQISLDSVRAHCDGLIARYKHPRRLRIVDEIPRTPAGKPDVPRVRLLVDS